MTWHNVLKGLSSVVALASPKIRQMLKMMLSDLYVVALNTENAFDDFLVELLAELMCVDLQKKRGD